MRKNYFLCTCLALIFIISSTCLKAETVLFGDQADQIVKGAKQVNLNDNSIIPSFIIFKEELQPTFGSPDLWLRLNFGLSEDFKLQQISSDNDKIGFTHFRYQQTFKEIILDGTMWIIHVKNNKVVSMNGLLFDQVKASVKPIIKETDALNSALRKINAEIYKWQIPQEEALLKKMLNNQDATYLPKGKLIFAFDSNKPGKMNYRLAYQFDIYSDKPLGRKYVSVDAITGDIIDIQDRIWESNANGTAVTGYAGTQPIISDSISGAFRLRESNRGAGQGMETYNLLTGTNYGAAVDFTDADNFWNNVNAAKDQYATDAHFAAEKTYDYYYSTYGRNSIDNAGLKLLSYVHYSSNYVNAFWDGTRMTYGDGNGSFTPLTSLDIGGHEITHGLTSNSANLIYSYESGALNESFSDCFGTAVEWYADPAHADWLIGEDIGAAFRSHSNPNVYGDPDTYLGTNWYTGTGDNGGVHTNSGVQNYWFYLLSVGGSGTNDIGNAFNVTGLGMAKAGAIAFRSLTVYLTSTSQYADARNYSIQAAIDLYGACSPEMFSTIDAWYAVGVGGTANTPTTISIAGNSSICNGDSTLITSKAPFGSTYAWYKGGVLINGQTGSILYAKQTGSYTVITSSCGNVFTSNAVSVNVITLAPAVNPAGTASACDNVVLTANNTSGYNIQWNKDGVPINGATSAAFTAGLSGNYSFTLQASVTPAVTFDNNSSVVIHDATCTPPAISTIAVSGLPASLSTSGITIRFSLTHTYDGDIDIVLTAPNGDVMGISRNNGGAGQNFVNTVISDAAPGNLSTGFAPFTGTYKPWGINFTTCIATNKTSFASIGNGTINPNGNWTLNVYDRFNIDSGTIDNWSIIFPAVYTPSPNCGPVTTPSTSVSIGSDAGIAVSPASTLKYELTQKNNFPAAGRSYGAAVTINDKGYYGFGDNAIHNDWWEYNAASDSWTQKSSCPISQSGGTAFSIGTKAYVIGGYNGNYLNSVYEWNSVTNAWQQKNNFGGGVRAYMASCTIDGKGYVFGGSENTGSHNDIWEYNSVTDGWTLKNNFPGSNGRKNLSVFVIAHKAYVGLGLSCSGTCNYSNEWFEYDPLNNIILQKSNFLGSLRESANGFSLSNKGYIIFGNANAVYFSDFWEYDALQDLWTLRGSYNGSGRTAASAAVIKNKAYVFCGNIASVASQNVIEFKTVNYICTNSPSSVTLQATSGTSYLWSNGATTQSIAAVPTGEYSVVVTSQSCSASAYVNIAIYPVPAASVTANGPLSFCSGGLVTLTSGPALSYLWSTGESTKDINVTSSGSYYVVTTGAGGCTNSSSNIVVTSRPGPPVTVIPSGPTTFCQGGSVTLNTYSYQAIPFAPISGSGNMVTLLDDQLSGSLPIGFNFTFFGNSYSNFNISSNGFISFGGTSSGCCSGQLIPNTAIPNNLISFAWTDLYPPAGGSIEYFTTGSAPNRKLVVKYNNIRHYPSGHLVTAQVILFETINQVEIHTTVMPTDGSLHTMGLENSTGTQAVLIPTRNRTSFSLTNDAVRFGTEPVNYLWNNGSTNASLNVTSSSSLSLTVTDQNGCTSTYGPVEVIVNQLPDVTVNTNHSTSLCAGDSVTLSVAASGSYLWSTGATTQNITVNTAGGYTVTVTSTLGCSNTSAVTNVTVAPCNFTMNLKVLIEGFYMGSGLMAAVVNPALYPALCDTIIVEMHNSSAPYGLVYSSKGTINTSGNGTFTFPAGALSNSYYIVVKHRNSMETWSSNPVLMSSGMLYDFTTNAAKAYGSNMTQTADHVGWAIYSGDISAAGIGIGYQDGVVESQDYSDMENAVIITLTGYVLEDITGDGVVESFDYSLMENNIFYVVHLIRP